MDPKNGPGTAVPPNEEAAPPDPLLLIRAELQHALELGSLYTAGFKDSLALKVRTAITKAVAGFVALIAAAALIFSSVFFLVKAAVSGVVGWLGSLWAAEAAVGAGILLICGAAGWFYLARSNRQIDRLISKRYSDWHRLHDNKTRAQSLH